MSDIRTRSLFTLKKDEAAAGFLSGSREVRNIISAHLLSCPPGHLLDAIASLQIDYKGKLDMSVLTLVEQQVEREMRLLNLGYSKTYKEALMAFELRKHNLLNGLTEELAGLRKAETKLDADVELSLAEIQLRQTILIEQEAILTKEKQALLKRKVEAERLSFDKELELVNAQLAYATRRLDLIPPIRAVIAAQQKVVEAERGPMSDALAELLVVKKQLASAKTGLIIPMIDKAEAILAYANEQESVIPYILAKARMSANLAAANYSYSVTFLLPAATAKLAYVSEQINALSYMEIVANDKMALAHQESSSAAKLVEKAYAEVELAQSELSVAKKYEERADAMKSTLLPAQRELVNAIERDVEYRTTASENRVKAAENEVEIAQYTAQGVVASVNAELAATRVSMAKINYTAYEKNCEASYYFSEANNASSIADATLNAVAIRSAAVQATTSAEVSAFAYVANARASSKARVAQTLYDAKSSALDSNSATQKDKARSIADVSSKAEMTVGLVHAISTEGGGGKK